MAARLLIVVEKIFCGDLAVEHVELDFTAQDFLLASHGLG